MKGPLCEILRSSLLIQGLENNGGNPFSFLVIRAHQWNLASYAPARLIGSLKMA